MRYLVEEIFGEEIAGQMGDFCTLDREGRLGGLLSSVVICSLSSPLST